LLAQVFMGRTVDPATAKTILQHLRGQDLRQAWAENGKPGTWGNVARRAKAAVEMQQASQQPVQQPQQAATAVGCDTDMKRSDGRSRRLVPCNQSMKRVLNRVILQSLRVQISVGLSMYLTI
jgi:hypothetical protein